MKPGRAEPLSILVVDDEHLVRETLSALLELQGHSVTTADDAAQALLLFEPGKFHIVFTDLSMPGMRGDNLAAEIKSRSPGQPIVMVTALSAHVAPNDHSIDLVVSKPFSIQNIVEAVARVTPSS